MLVVITGAAKGFGRAIALACADRSNLRLSLFSRDGEGLRETERLINSINTNARVSTEVADFATLTHDALIQRLDSAVQVTDEEQLYVIHNAGSLGEIAPLSNWHPNAIDEFIKINITNTTIMSSYLSRLATQRRLTGAFVNISSLWAVQPTECMSMYCTAKAARDMLFKVLALELKAAGSGMKTLNYAPGPLDTDMQRLLRETESPLQGMFAQMHTKGQLVAPGTSAQKLWSILDTNEYESGAHVDFFDA